MPPGIGYPSPRSALPPLLAPPAPPRKLALGDALLRGGLGAQANDWGSAVAKIGQSILGGLLARQGHREHGRATETHQRNLQGALGRAGYSPEDAGIMSLLPPGELAGAHLKRMERTAAHTREDEVAARERQQALADRDAGWEREDFRFGQQLGVRGMDIAREDDVYDRGREHALEDRAAEWRRGDQVAARQRGWQVEDRDFAHRVDERRRYEDRQDARLERDARWARDDRLRADARVTALEDQDRERRRAEAAAVQTPRTVDVSELFGRSEPMEMTVREGDYPPPTREEVQGWQNDFERDTSYWRDAVAASERLMTLLDQDSPAADILAVINAFQTVEPQGVAREGEQQSLRQSTGILDSMTGFIQAQTGEGGRLAPRTRNQLAMMAAELANVSADAFNEKRDFRVRQVLETAGPDMASLVFREFPPIGEVHSRNYEQAAEDRGGLMGGVRRFFGMDGGREPLDTDVNPLLAGTDPVAFHENLTQFAEMLGAEGRGASAAADAFIRDMGDREPVPEDLNHFFTLVEQAGGQVSDEAAEAVAGLFAPSPAGGQPYPAAAGRQGGPEMPDVGQVLESFSDLMTPDGINAVAQALRQNAPEAVIGGAGAAGRGLGAAAGTAIAAAPGAAEVGARAAWEGLSEGARSAYSSARRYHGKWGEPVTDEMTARFDAILENLVESGMDAEAERLANLWENDDYELMRRLAGGELVGVREPWMQTGSVQH